MNETYDFDRRQVQSLRCATLRALRGVTVTDLFIGPGLSRLPHPFPSILVPPPWRGVGGGITPLVELTLPPSGPPNKTVLERTPATKWSGGTVTPPASSTPFSPFFLPQASLEPQGTASQRKVRPLRRSQAMGLESSVGYSMPGVRICEVTTGRGAT